MMGESEGRRPAGPRRGIRRGIYLVPSAFTIGNILCGFYAVINSVKGYQALPEAGEATRLFDHAAQAIGWAVLLDGLDGRIARMTGATSEFGVELDSIADVVTFGIAPAVLVYSWGYGSTPGLESWAWAVSFFFLICGALRLARFNVQARAPRFAAGGGSPKLDKRSFVGLPIPMAAGLIAAIIHFSPHPVAAYFLEGRAAGGHLGRLEQVGQMGQGRAYSLALLALVAGLAVLMVSTLRYTSFKNVGPRSNKPFIILPLFAVVAAGIWFYSDWVLLLLSGLYVAHGVVLKLWGLVNRLRRPLRRPPAPVEP